jgi:rhodanese-related sulfurtransferase
LDFEIAHIPYSRSVSLDDLTTIAPDGEGKPLIVVAASDEDPLLPEADLRLRERSFPSLVLRGGFLVWSAEGKPTISTGIPDSFVDQSKVTFLRLPDLKRFLETHESPILFLDVRGEGAFAKRHVKGALNVPLDSIESKRKTLPVGRTFIIYGANEVEAFRAGVRLFDLNISTARVLRGTFDDIIQTGVATEGAS